MRIYAAELTELHLALREPFLISSGGGQDRRIILLQLLVDGVEAWSECVAAGEPGYSYETADTAWQMLSSLILPGIVGREFDSPGDALAPVSWIRGHRMAKAAVEMAAWDARARLDGVPLSKLLGGERERVPVGVSVGIQETDEVLLEKVAGYVADGYARIKIKIKPGRDIEMLRAVRERYPDLPIMADANSAYTLDDVERLKLMDELDLMMIEQPLPYDDYLHHARLQSQIDTPICLDESIRSVRDAELMMEIGAGRIVNIKPGRVGGLSEAIGIHDLCVANGVRVWHGGMLESGVGRAHNLALASLPGFDLPGDISASRRYWEEDIVSPEFTVENGTMEVPRGIGFGVELRRDRIEAATVRTARVGPGG